LFESDHSVEILAAVIVKQHKQELTGAPVLTRLARVTASGMGEVLLKLCQECDQVQARTVLVHMIVSNTQKWCNLNTIITN
jgi:hypothetical protein